MRMVDLDAVLKLEIEEPERVDTFSFCMGLNSLWKAIAKLPVIGAVKCEECVFWNRQEEPNEHVGICKAAGWLCGPNGYCMYGKKVE